MKRKSKQILKILWIFNLIFIILILTITIVFVCSVPNFSLRFPEKKSVCLDAGHGGKDTGATSNGRYEKDDVLKLTLKVADYLKSHGVKVYLTRDSDAFASLKARCDYANKKKANLFVSIHRNSAENGSGIEIWLPSTPNQFEESMAATILKEFQKTNHITKIRGIKKGYRKNSEKNYFVNANTNMPSCLLEIGFITSEEDNMLFDTYFEEYAIAIGNGILNTLNEIE